MSSLIKPFFHFFVAIVVMSAGGCTVKSGINNVQSVRDKDYIFFPKKLTIIADNEISSNEIYNGVISREDTYKELFNDKFKTIFINNLKECGVLAQSIQQEEIISSQFYNTSDSVLFVNKLSAETTYATNVYGTHKTTTKESVEFVLNSLNDKKVVWRAKVDFVQDRIAGGVHSKDYDPLVNWANALRDLMIKDGLLKSCNLQ